jgi:hypothetical protein
MTDHIERQELADVLDSYMAAVKEPSPSALAEWIRRYPQYEQDLTDFTVAWIEMDSLPLAERTEIEDDDTLVLRGMSIVQDLLHHQQEEQAQKSHDQRPFAGFVAGGYSLAQMAERLNLSDALVRKLDLRLIRYATMPLQLIEDIANVAQHEFVDIARYLSGAPTLVQGASYKSKHTPSLSLQEDFFDAVRNDPQLDEERRKRWLSLEQVRKRSPDDVESVG